MPLNLPKDYQSQLFTGDLVRKANDPKFKGKVLRAWAEEDGQHLESCQHGESDLNRPLQRGEVGIADVSGTHALAILPESDLVLLDRDFVRGDVIKRSLDKIESGVVMKVSSFVQLEHCISGETVAGGGWVPMNKLASSLCVEAGDKVVYNNWLGTIKDVFEEGTMVNMATGESYKIAEMGGYLAIGRSAHNLYPPDQIPEGVLGITSTPEADVVVDVRPIVIYVNWEVLNQMVPVSEQDNYPKPPSLWTGPELQKLTHIDMLHAAPPQVEQTVIFKDELDDATYGVHPTRHLQNSIIVRTMRITATNSVATVRWQDGHITEEPGTSIVPYTNIDDYESWPGDHVNWRGDQGNLRPAVVQTFNPHQRTAEILFLDQHEKQLVSVLEIDTGGPDRQELGVRYGTLVLLCNDNGCPVPQVPSLGEIDSDLEVNAKRQEMASLAERYAQNPSAYNVLLPAGNTGDVDWFGEVAELGLDGSVGVDVPSGIRKRVPIKQIILLNEILPEGIEPQGGQDDASMASDDSWETVGDDRPVGAEDVEENDDGDKVMTDVENDEVDDAVGGSSPAKAFTVPINHDHSTLVDDEHWKPFDILEEAPVDHAYIKEPRLAASSKAFYSRLQKEHRALASSLPDNINVRSYEDRTDLLRCLIVGPEGTPYADAPFVFDVYLNPTKFPYEPPAVYFHSHTFGHGRCNPNLYEEGKVCLSILGTWQGDKSETWNPNKSSLLQVFVSISGLVLVRNPYHCEPAFAKLEGTREGKVNSRLYSEKAYVLSRSFVRTALEKPPAGLESEIKWLYLTRGRLDRVIAHATALIEKAEATAKMGTAEESEEAAWNADAVGSLTTGAALTIKRTIASLVEIRNRN